jgi:hypothetical protein
MNLVGRRVKTVRVQLGTHVEGLGNVKTILNKDTAHDMTMIFVEQGVYVSGKGIGPDAAPFEFVLPFQQCISIQLAPETKVKTANEEDRR